MLHRSVSASHRKERLSFLLFAVALLMLAAPAAASAYWHLDTNLPPANTREVRGATTFVCSDCHVTWTDGDDEGNVPGRVVSHRRRVQLRPRRDDTGDGSHVESD